MRTSRISDGRIRVIPKQGVAWTLFCSNPHNSASHRNCGYQWNGLENSCQRQKTACSPDRRFDTIKEVCKADSLEKAIHAKDPW